MGQGLQLQQKSRQASLAGNGKHKSSRTAKDKASLVLVCMHDSCNCTTLVGRRGAFPKINANIEKHHHSHYFTK